jgi:hypothetical protein
LNTEPLRTLAGEDGPFASVYLDFSHDTEDAAAQLDLRRREIRSGLVEQGADERLTDTVDAAIADHKAPAGRAGLGVVAGGTALVTQLLRRPPPQPVTRYSELPYLLPLVELAQPDPPHVIVVADRTGADFRVVGRNGEVLTEDELTGREHPVHKVRGGGWSHRSMQSHVEETVKQNLHQVAEETARLATRVGARLVVVAGEVQARSGLMAALPDALGEVAVEAQAGSRAAGTDEQALSHEIDELIDRLLREDEAAVLDRYRAETGRQDGGAVAGLAAAAAALRDSNAEVLLADPQRLEPVTVWGSAGDPGMLGSSRSELEELGVASPVQLRADEAIPLAAIAVGAQLHVTRDLDLPDGVGVLLRYV